jgi:hypothetical protein
MVMTVGGYVTELSGLHPPAAEPVFLQRSPSRFVIGCDLAQQYDYTALSVVESKDGVLNYDSEIERHCGVAVHPEIKVRYQDVRHLERLRGVSYVEIVDRLAELMARPPLCGDHRAKPGELIVDGTGVGKGVTDLIADRRIKFVGVIITSGTVTPETNAGRGFYHVSKQNLVSQLDASLHSGRLRIARALQEGAHLGQELKDFRRAISQTGRATFSARSNQHDDLVLSVSLCCWWLSRPPGSPAGVGTW